MNEQRSSSSVENRYYVNASRDNILHKWNKPLPSLFAVFKLNSLGKCSSVKKLSPNGPDTIIIPLYKNIGFIS